MLGLQVVAAEGQRLLVAFSFARSDDGGSAPVATGARRAPN
jgi:hypothetical protein